MSAIQRRYKSRCMYNRALRDTKFDNPRGSGITTNNHVSAARVVELKPEKRNGSKIN